MTDAAACLFGLLILATVLFQLALAGGAPWGKLAMAGRFPGRFPTSMRVAALAQAVLLLLLATVVFVRAGWVLSGAHAFSRIAIWGVVLASALSLVMNLITPSRWERALWAPVALLLTASSLVVALD